MRRIKADVVFPVSTAPIENGVVWVDDDGKILALKSPGEEGYGHPDEEYQPGWLVPGWVNSHCHLELSGYHGEIPEHTGLDGFIRRLAEVQANPDAFEAMKRADAQMAAEGVMAVLDISNQTNSFGIKKISTIQYYTLAERYGFLNERASSTFETGIQVWKALRADELRGNICLHAPYSASEALMQKVKDHIEQEGGIYSIHFLESAGERELFEHHRGPLFERLEQLRFAPKKQLGKMQNVLEYIQPGIPKSGNLLFVHNTFISDIELDMLETYGSRVFLCICPEANRYIENTLPPLPLLMTHSFSLCVGTDSLASARSLSMLENLKLLQQAYPEISFASMLPWATLNGARLMQLEDELGSLEPGKHPGLVIIRGVDNSSKKILPHAVASRIA